MKFDFSSTDRTFNNILRELEDVWAMSDILEIKPTNNKEILFEEFLKQFGAIFNWNQSDRHTLGMELIYRIEFVKNRIGQSNRNWYKNIYIVKNLNEYMQVLADIRALEGEKELWFRGHSDAKLQMIPNLYRGCYEVSTAYGTEIKPRIKSWWGRGQTVIFPNLTKMLADFKEQAQPLVNFKVENDFEWLFLAQHYGMLTPLLDWSEDPLVGLFFAIDGLDVETLSKCNIDDELGEFYSFKRISEAASVHVFDPGCFNKNTYFRRVDEHGNSVPIDYPIRISDKNINFFQRYLMGDFDKPICFKAPKKEYRICRQSGNFLCYGTDITPIDAVGICRETLYKIYIPYAAIKTIKQELALLNIIPTAIYGEFSPIDDCAMMSRHTEEAEFHKLIDSLNLKYSSIEK